MRIRYLKQDYLEKLFLSKADRMKSLYERETPWLSEFFCNDEWFAQSKIEVAGDLALLMDGDPPQTDAVNSVRIHRLFRNKLSLVQAADPRLWAYLCHETYWNYMKWRWPTEKADIKARYFVNGRDSRALSRNGISRLWWCADLTYVSSSSNPYELTEVLLQNQNIQHNLIERSFGRNREVLHSVLYFVRDNPDIFADKNAKENIEKLGKAINIKGGAMLLDCLTRKQIFDYLDKVFQ